MNSTEQKILMIEQYINFELLLLAVTAGVCLTFIVAIYALFKKSSTPQLPVHNSVDLSDTHKLFDSMQSQLRSLEQKIHENKQLIQRVEHDIPQSAITHYNPFRDNGVGGNQSFSLANIDKNGNGSIITHLFSRDMSRVSAKKITNWESSSELSPEEKEVLSEVDAR